MTATYSESTDLWEVTASWQQYEATRLQKLKQQRKRMQTMKDVVSQYSQTIRKLEVRNKLLENENEELKNALALPRYHEDQELIAQKYSQLSIELEKQRKIRQTCELKIDSLAQELASASIYQHNIASHDSFDPDYELLQKLYQELKDEVYVLHRENLSLKDVIRDQSRYCYEKKGFWKESEKLWNLRTANTQGLKLFDEEAVLKSDGNQRKKEDKKSSKSASERSQLLQYSCSDNDSPSFSNIQTSNPKINSGSVKREKMDQNDKAEDDKHKMKNLRVEIKKLNNLIQKFRVNEQQQLHLIEILKKNSSKLCLCHEHGRSSKKSLQSQVDTKTVSFRKSEVHV